MYELRGESESRSAQNLERKLAFAAAGGLRAGHLRIGNRRLWSRQVRRNLLQTIAQRFADAGKDLGTSFSQRFRGFCSNAVDRLARLVIEAGHGREHPLIRNILEPVAMLLGSLIAHLAVYLVHLRSMRLHRRLPGLD